MIVDAVGLLERFADREELGRSEERIFPGRQHETGKRLQRRHVPKRGE
jgi:hypothetical protein